MTRAPRQALTRPGATGAGAILSRLLALLALILFGVPQGHAEGRLAHPGPVAESQAEQSQGIVTVQRPLLRAHLPGEPSSDTATPGDSVESPEPGVAAMVSPAPDPSLPPLAIRIRPSVRGPPAA